LFELFTACTAPKQRNEFSHLCALHPRILGISFAEVGVTRIVLEPVKAPHGRFSEPRWIVQERMKVHVAKKNPFQLLSEAKLFIHAF
jgi:hypothetical protein